MKPLTDYWLTAEWVHRCRPSLTTPLLCGHFHFLSTLFELNVTSICFEDYHRFFWSMVSNEDKDCRTRIWPLVDHPCRRKEPRLSESGAIRHTLCVVGAVAVHITSRRRHVLRVVIRVLVSVNVSYIILIDSLLIIHNLQTIGALRPSEGRQPAQEECVTWRRCSEGSGMASVSEVLKTRAKLQLRDKPLPPSE